MPPSELVDFKLGHYPNFGFAYVHRFRSRRTTSPRPRIRLQRCRERRPASRLQLRKYALSQSRQGRLVAVDGIEPSTYGL